MTLGPDATFRVSMEIVEKKVKPHPLAATFLTEVAASLSNIGRINAHVLIANVTFSEAAKAAVKKLELEKLEVVTSPTILGYMLGAEFSDTSTQKYLVRDFLKGPVEMPYPSIFGAQKGMDNLQIRLRVLKDMLREAEAPTQKTVEI